MSQPALDTFSVTRHAIDPRADGAKRVVRISRTHVTIERSLQGVRMHVGVPVAAYRTLVIAARLPSGRATLYLRHEDSDLDVVLAVGEAIEVAQKARAWNVFLGKPIAVEDASIRTGRTIGRRKKRAQPTRRSSFARRRQIGDPARTAVTFAGEHEIIARN